MPALNVDGLDEFVRRYQEAGGDIAHPLLAPYFPFRYQFRTEVDGTLDPFSPAYFAQQLALYEEIAGRPLNQWSGELHPVEIEPLVRSPNPLGILNPSHVAEHVRALSAMLSIAGLRDGARVLDMGAGHGLSSEVFAACGCTVDAVDIDPALNELARRRSRDRHLAITRHHLNFDDLSSLPDGAYDAVFFFQSFHHCLRPWELIERLKRKLKPDGLIGFTGEPMQDLRWSTWGLRLDHESVFVARAFGWFESGWTPTFIRRCFQRQGLWFQLFDGGHGGGGIGIATQGSPFALVDRAAAVGHAPWTEANATAVPGHGVPGLRPSAFATQIGQPAEWWGEPAFRVEPGHGGGYLLFGPYLTLAPGRYRVRFSLERVGAGNAPARFDVAHADGTVVLLEDALSQGGWIERSFETHDTLHGVETRLRITEPEGWCVSRPRIERL